MHLPLTWWSCPDVHSFAYFCPGKCSLLEGANIGKQIETSQLELALRDPENLDVFASK